MVHIVGLFKKNMGKKEGNEDDVVENICIFVIFIIIWKKKITMLTCLFGVLSLSDIFLSLILHL